MKLFSFDEFLTEKQSNEEYVEAINEGFKSPILQKLASSKKGAIGKEFFGVLSKLGVAASEVTNYDIKQVTPSDAEKLSKQDPNLILIYYSEKAKENPFTDNYSWYNKIDGDCVLAVVKGKQFMGLKYDKWASKGGKAEYALVSSGDAQKPLGGVDKTGGKYGSGLTSLKRMAAVADVVYVINPAELQTTLDLRAERADSKKGAIAFKDDRDFKKENLARYKEILTKRASSSPVDKMVEEAIDTLSEKIKKAVAEGKKGRYELIIGLDKAGKEISMSDAGYLMQRILNRYSQYASYVQQSEESEKRWNMEDTYYSREAANAAKDIKDYLNQVNAIKL